MREGADPTPERLSIKMCRVPTHLRPGQMYFRPALVFQCMLEEHVADVGLEFSLDVSSGTNRARFISDVNAKEGSERYHEILRSQLSLVNDDGQMREDAQAVRKQLLAAGSWGDADKTAHIIRTSYVTQAMADEVLIEVAKCGASEVVQILLQAGANPDTAGLGGKTALHVACEGGHEETAGLLIRAMSAAAVDSKTPGDECTAMDVLRRADLNGMARRLEALRQACQVSKET